MEESGWYTGWGGAEVVWGQGDGSWIPAPHVSIKSDMATNIRSKCISHVEVLGPDFEIKLTPWTIGGIFPDDDEEEEDD